ncbi:hypothetical protein SAHL_04945 [Salinisphaera orenii YIM 95161]|uniref:Uncharacterized protein n=1 Tax=Salinisphaera orenii YIM 95161 TaxID=1051139 RepID=A0A423Q1Z8_9GAMM|nr:hypothetical protein SAHL_04945 [Salinisphaera halophila YIM 95161]
MGIPRAEYEFPGFRRAVSIVMFAHAFQPHLSIRATREHESSIRELLV